MEDLASAFSSVFKRPEGYDSFDDNPLSVNFDEYEKIYYASEDVFRNFLVKSIRPINSIRNLVGNIDEIDEIDELDIPENKTLLRILKSKNDSKSDYNFNLDSVADDFSKDLTNPEERSMKVDNLKNVITNMYDDILGSINKGTDPVKIMIYLAITEGDIHKLKIIFDTYLLCNKEIIYGPLMFREAFYSTENYRENIDFLLEKYAEGVIKMDYPEKNMPHNLINFYGKEMKDMLNKFMSKIYVLDKCFNYPIPNMAYFIEKCSQLDLTIPTIEVNSDEKIEPIDQNSTLFTPDWIEKMKFWIEATKNSCPKRQIKINYDWLHNLAENADFTKLLEILPKILNNNDNIGDIPQPIIIQSNPMCNKYDKDEFKKLVEMSREYGLKMKMSIEYPFDDLGDYSVENVINLCY